MILFERESRIVGMKAANARAYDKWNNTKVFGRTVDEHPQSDILNLLPVILGCLYFE